MKGTAPRGRWASEDEGQRNKLGESEKNQAENLMIVDLLRNDLGRVSVPGTVRVPRLFDVERYATLFQMTSTIESVCRPGTGLVDLFGAPFPCGCVTGAPKISSMKMIRSLEPSPRGVYTGSIGLVRPGGDCTFSVAIRTLALDTETKRAVFGVGGGITYDSAAEDEYGECLAKARFLTHPSPAFQLIETLRLEVGVYFLPDRHVARMLESAAFFEFILDEGAVRAALEAIQMEHLQWAWKVRLLVSSRGEIHSEASPLIGPKDQLWRVGLATAPLDSADRFLFHKTTHRSFYEQPVRERPDCGDLLFWNERGEVTESSIANFVLEMDGERWTPPRSSGLLAGTFREELLALGEIRERVIFKEELKRAERLFLINSVRRWMPVRWVDG
jgi:para-aminobenzoate synthetase/4-amino-4-deoxychorismate lyase